MSVYSEWKTEMTDKAILLAALEQAGVAFTEAKPQGKGETARLHIAQNRNRGVWSYGGIDLVERNGVWAWAGDSDVLRSGAARSPQGAIGATEMWYKALAAKKIVEEAGQHLTLSLDAATGLVLGEYTMEVAA